MSIGADISQNIQQAIKAKLIELSSYVDDELPDYIMIMIANRKKEEQMTESLSLFLGNNTKVFTKWLYELLSTLRGKKDDSAPKPASSTSTTKQIEDKNEKPTAALVNEKPTVAPIVNEESNHAESKEALKAPSKVEAPPTTTCTAPAEPEIEILPDSGDVLDLELYGSNEMTANDSMLAEGPPEAKQAPSSSKESKSKTSDERTKNAKPTSENKEKVVTKRKIQLVATGNKTKPRTSADKEAKTSKVEKEREKVSYKSSSSYSRSLESERSSSKYDNKEKSSSGREKTKKLKRSRSSKDDSQKRRHASKPTREWDMVKESKASWKESDNYEEQSKRQSTQKPRYNRNDEHEVNDDDDEPVVRKIASTVQSSISANREYVSEGESEEEKFSSSAVISKVSVPGRHSRLPPTKQANKSLLLRAVSEAQTSMKRHKKSKEKSQKDTVKSVKSRLGNLKEHSPEIPKPKKSKKSFEENFEIQIEQPTKRTLKRKNIVKSGMIKKIKSPEQPQNDLPEDKTVQYKKTKQAKSIKTDLEPVSSTVEDKSLYTADRRRFISRSSLSDDAEDKREQISVVRNASEVMDDSSVQFDRRNLHVTKSVEPSPEHSLQSSDSEPVTPPRKRQSINKQGKGTKKRSPSPCFIVTLDGTSSKSKNETPKAESTSKVKKPQKQPFKAVPIVAPSSASSATVKSTKTNSVKPLTIKRDSIETSDDELSVMREKLLRMQEEARKLKTMQIEQLNILKQSSTATKASVKPETSKSIHVANVHFSATEKKLSEHFGICGKVQRVTVLKDQFTGHPKGFAYLEFEDQSSVETALALDNTMFCSRLIKVTRKSSAPPTPVKFAPTRFVARRPRSFGVHPRARYSARAALATFRPRYHGARGRNKTWVKPGFVAT